MKTFLSMLMLIAALTTTPALTGATDIKPGVKMPNPSLKLPQSKIKTQPKSLVKPQTGQESTGTNTQTQPTGQQETPQGALLRFHAIQFSSASPDEPPCMLRWQTTITNDGATPSNPNLVLRPSFRRTGETTGQEGQAIQLAAIQPGSSSQVSGLVPERINQESEIVLTLLDGGSTAAITSAILPECARPSANNVTMGEMSFSGSQATIEVRNTGAVDVGPMDCLLRGITNETGSNVYITGSTITCIPAGAAQSIVFQLPETTHLGYLVQLKLFQKGEIFLEKTIPHP